MSLEVQNEELTQASVLLPFPFSVFIHSSSLFSTVPFMCGSVCPPTLHPCLSHPLSPCHTVACVVDGASGDWLPTQLGVLSKTSFQSQTPNYLPILLASTEHLGATC